MKAQNQTLSMIKALGIVSAVCGLIIVLAYQSTLEAVKANKRIAAERSVFHIFPAAQSISAWRLEEGKIVPTEDAQLADFFAVYGEKKMFLGIAALGHAKGYGDQVRLMYAYEPQCQCIRGIAVVSMRETPGIGDKITTDKNFLANFNQLDVRLNDSKTALHHALEVVKNGSKTQPWQIDAIAGATITSRAVGRAIDESASALLPILATELNQLEKMER